MQPKIRGKVGEIITAGEHKGKFAFEMWLTSLGGGEGDTLGHFGPFDTEEIALKELNVAAEIACKALSKNIKDADPTRYIDMKTNELKSWS